jgi:hypothetical protein
LLNEWQGTDLHILPLSKTIYGTAAQVTTPPVWRQLEQLLEANDRL